MGSWNKTCGLSNLPIMGGEPVYVFVLEKAGSRNSSNCYSTWLYKPAMIPFQAEYNDYGAGENCSGVGLKILMNNIRDVLIEMPQGENKYHDIPVVRNEFTVENFFETVHESRLLMKNAYGETVNIDFVMCRKDIVDYVLDNYQIELYVGDSKGTCGYENSYISIKFQNLVDDIPNLIKLVTNPSSDALVKSCNQQDVYWLLGNLRTTGNSLIMRFTNVDSYKYNYSSIFRNVYEIIGDNRDNTQCLAEILTDILKFIWIDMYMTHVRKTWIPAGHEGSQSDERNAYRTLIAATSAVLDRKDHEDAEMNSE